MSRFREMTSIEALFLLIVASLVAIALLAAHYLGPFGGELGETWR